MRVVISLLSLVLIPGALLAASPTKKSGPPPSLSDYQPVEATDFYMNPGLYLGKPVEFYRMVCIPIAEKGFACKTLNSRLVVFAPEIRPAPEKKIVKERCDPSEDLYLQRCKRTIRLVPEKIEGEKGKEYSQQRLIIRTDVIDLAPHAEDSSED